jgi:hypothetical protein
MTWQPHSATNGRTATASFQPPEAQSEVPDRKEQKREAKRRRDARRQPDSREKFKILLDVIREQRHVVDLEDHRARYALIIIGGINAAVLFAASRAVGTGSMAGALPHWLLGLLVVYLALTLLFVLAAVDCLRPRALKRRGLLHWEGAVTHDVSEYRTAWSEVKMDDLNGEAVLVAHMLAGLVHEKYRANLRLYGGLKALVMLGAVLLVFLGMMFLIQ